MKRAFVVLSVLALLVLCAAGGVQAKVSVTGDGTGADSPSACSTLTEATGCVHSGSDWLGKGQNIKTDSGTHWAGVIFVHIPPADPTKIPTFCTDLATSISQGKCFVADGPTACPITWLLNNGYGPDNPATNTEAAARQAAVWYFSDGLTVNSTDPVYARTQQIIAAVPDPCVLPVSAPVMTLEPASAINFLPGGEVHNMTVTVTQDGAPLVGKVVNLTTTFGALSSSSVTTDADGRASFTLTSNVTGSATVTAKFSYVLPAGTRMVKLPGEPDQQVIVLGTPQSGNVIATATKTWETGTKLIVHKFSDNNTNGVQDGGEESLQGWTMRLYRLEGSSWQLVATKTTDAAGNAIFSNLSPGVYRAEETLQSGWLNTTPNPSAQVTLPAGGQATINFGNVALAVIKAWKFYDLDMDGAYDAGEPLLDGWTMNIWPAINGIGSGLTAGGSFSFIDLPPGTYRVWETPQPDWLPTTSTVYTITVGASDFAEVWFGNVQLDWGDLPEAGTLGTPYPVNYPTLMASDGARHVIHSIQLGPGITAETDGQPCPFCNQDINDGVTPVGLSTWEVGPGGGAVDVQVTAIGASSVTTGYINAWIDWNHDGELDADEQILVDAPVTVGTTQRLAFDIPVVPTWPSEAYYARFRLYDAPQGVCLQSSGPATSCATPTGSAIGGEVEDYRWDFTPLAVRLAAFDAQQVDKHVLVSWETVSEVSNRGFNLYRGPTPDGWDRQLNETLIPSQSPGSPGGFLYTWEDRAELTSGQSYYYWLQDVELNGATALHGPVSVEFTLPTALALATFGAAPVATGLPALAGLAALALAALAGRRRQI